MSDYREAWEAAIKVCRERNDEIASLRAELAEANSKLAALNLCEPGFLDRKLRELDVTKAQLASARKAAIQEADEIIGLLWVDLFKADQVKASGADCFDRRRAQLRALSLSDEEGK